MDGALGEFALGEIESAGDTSSISPNSILSAEAWGSPTVTADNYAIFPNSINSAEAWGEPAISQAVTYKSVSRIK